MTLGRCSLRIFCSRGTPPKISKSGPDSGPDCLMCAIFARQRTRIQGCRGGTAVERIWHTSDSQGLGIQVKVLKILQAIPSSLESGKTGSSQGQNLALTGLCAPNSLGSGEVGPAVAGDRCRARGEHLKPVLKTFVLKRAQDKARIWP